MRTLQFMGIGDVEPFRCRIYGGGDVSNDDRERLDFLRRLSRVGILDSPAYDQWIRALNAKGWLGEPERESAPGGGHYLRWRLNDAGRAALAELEAS